MTKFNAPLANSARLHPPWREAVIVTLILGVAMATWLLSLGGLSLGWDTLNHHVYLGWLAVEGDRLRYDVFAAGSMSCQYPYAYAPLYWLQAHGATGVQAGLVLALPGLAAAPAVWLLCWALLPVYSPSASLARFAWVTLAFLSPLWWSLLDGTSNDLMSTLPTIWAIALVAWRALCDVTETTHPAISKASLKWYALAGALAALGLIIKISQIFPALGMLILAIAFGPSSKVVMQRVIAISVGGGAVVLLLWWPWARHVWRACGSPIYPVLTDTLRPLSGLLP